MIIWKKQIYKLVEIISYSNEKYPVFDGIDLQISRNYKLFKPAQHRGLLMEIYKLVEIISYSNNSIKVKEHLYLQISRNYKLFKRCGCVVFN